MSAAEQRRLELDRKKQKLAEMRSQRRQNEDARVQQLLHAPNENGTGQNGQVAPAHRQTLSSEQVEEILRGVGIATEPNVREEPAENHVESANTNSFASSASHPRISAMLSVDLEFSTVQTASTDNKDSAIYSKGTQTDDERISVGEFSLGSQEFDYDDDMIMPMEHGQFREHIKNWPNL
uniref:Uncharacterized protein n=1 Tax=Caenorhabditis japonica TaxID=281687 RepID=A0A8R1E0A9_CAEJA